MAHRPDDRPVVGFFENESGAEYSFSVAGPAGLPTLDDVGGMSELEAANKRNGRSPVERRGDPKATAR